MKRLNKRQKKWIKLLVLTLLVGAVLILSTIEFFNREEHIEFNGLIRTETFYVIVIFLAFIPIFLLALVLAIWFGKDRDDNDEGDSENGDLKSRKKSKKSKKYKKETETENNSDGFGNVSDTDLNLGVKNNDLEDSDDVSLEKKISLLSSALGCDLDPSLVRFLELLSQHRRLELLSRMLISFIEQYRSVHNIKVGRLVTAVPVSGLRERLEEIFAEKMSADVHLEEKVDDSLIGGFVFELDGLRLDASVERQLERLRSQLVEKNNRIV